MWLRRIKKTLHNTLKVRRHVAKLGVVDPVPSGIRGKGKVENNISVDFVIELEEDTEASMCKDGMCRFRENVII
jgi:hypothetical protein